MNTKDKAKEQRIQRLLMIVVLVQGVAIAVFIGWRLQLSLYLVVPVALVVLIAVLVGMQTAAKQFEDS
ncbi:MAG TPA: hypothetical protein PLB18_00540 [Acidobacteriota bacterium]|nr:hypothetical protein [Acidobacteriota bacterium]HNC43256.1 hypothetical protein [Acidobacteriota bacterium]HND17851.1 hypothetical protein [Acidobacteriota bacterium]HNG91681.1 hypothetical protein [Acidobacteriota bacterium]HNH82447.1 hypothetical protein [Acidobacteriota bacterium]